MTAEFYALKGMFLAQINKYVLCGLSGKLSSCSFSQCVAQSWESCGFMMTGEASVRDALC